MNNNFGIRKKMIHYKKYNKNMFGGNGDEDVKNSEELIPSANVGQITANDNGMDQSNYPDSIASNGPIQQLPYMEPTHLTLYSIPQGTELYHGSKDLSQFDTTRINIGKDQLTAFFSPNKDFAASYINECVSGEGYIHKFITNKQMDRIYILSANDKNLHLDEKTLENKFCRGGEFGKMNGIGFFVADKIKDRFSDTNNSSRDTYSSEFAFCDPSQYLTYVGTFRCIGPRSLSTIYKFDE
jgi:hypothetical protein